jgi:hypothetical protein
MIVGNSQKKKKMGWDNRLFDVNGRGAPMLAMTLELALKQDWGYFDTPDRRIKGWRGSEQHGILLTTWTRGAVSGDPWNRFSDNGLSIEDAANFVIDRLERPELAMVPYNRWEDDIDHDGDNSVGWRAYVGEWGRIGDDYAAFIAVKKVYLWHGK